MSRWPTKMCWKMASRRCVIARHLDDLAHPLRAVVAGELAERPFDFSHIGKHVPSITISASAGTMKSSPQVSDGVSRSGSPMMAPTLA